MDYLDLFKRTPIHDQPVSVIVRGTIDRQRIDQVIERVSHTVASRGIPLEVIFLVDSYPRELPPVRVAGIRIRFHIRPCPQSGESLMSAIRHARFPIILFADTHSSWTMNEIDEFFTRLSEADIVVGKRKKRWSAASFLWPIDRIVRCIFAVPFADPFCAIKLARKDAIEAIHLDQSGLLADFELAAKSTYMIRLVDEVALSMPWTGPNVCKAVLGSPRTLLSFLCCAQISDRLPVAAVNNPELVSTPSWSPNGRSCRSKWRRDFPRRHWLPSGRQRLG